MTNIKIGIFDSGIGGLTVAKEVKKALPEIPIVYFGDTAHLPYGDKSKEAVMSYCIGIGDFLVSKGCTHIIIACNTASAYGYKPLKKHLKNVAKVYDVITPVVHYISTHYTEKKVGIIATKGTTKSRIYPRKINAKNPLINVSSCATPLLAPMIEEGFFNNNISKTIIHNYLSKKELKNIDVLTLACTHYPLIEQAINGFYKKKVKILNSAVIVATHVKAKIKIGSPNIPIEDLFYVSDFTPSFQQSAQLFFGKKISLFKNNIWRKTLE